MKMNDIFLWNENIGAVTDRIEASSHTHWMYQFFISLSGTLMIDIENHEINTSAIIVNKQVRHEFCGKGKHHLTFLVNPTSEIGRQLASHFEGNESYYLIPEKISRQLVRIATEKTIDYSNLVQVLTDCFSSSAAKNYDLRVEELLKNVTECKCQYDSHKVSELADQLNVSQSRLSHIFKENTGIPLKSYLLLHQLFTAYHQIFAGMSVTEAAHYAGFDSSAHFAATSKKMTGMSAKLISKDSRFLKVTYR